MRFLILLVSLACAVAAALIAIDTIDLGRTPQVEQRIAVAWAAWSFAAYVLAQLIGDRP